jgi:hypothetical protein
LPFPDRGWRSRHRWRCPDNYRTTIETDGLVLHVPTKRCTANTCTWRCTPANFECSRKPSHHPGVLTLLPEQFWREVQPVGRLDHDTTGMLLMSDDGPFIHAQSSPKRHVPDSPGHHARARGQADGPAAGRRATA